MSEENELLDSRKDDQILVVEDIQLQRKCSALLRQVKTQLPVVMHYTMTLIANKPQMTREDTEALHSWQLLQEMMDEIHKLAKDTDSALATCFFKLQDLHMRVIYDKYQPDILKKKEPEAVNKITRRCKAKYKDFEDAVRKFQGIKQLMDTQKDLKRALRDIGADWTKKVMVFVEKVDELREARWEKQQSFMEKKKNKMMEYIRERERVNLEQKVEKLVYWEKRSWMAEKNAREFQKLDYEASRDYAQESETKTHYYTTGWWFWTSFHKKTEKNPRKEEKMRKKKYLEEEAREFEQKHGKINDEIANLRNELKADRKKVAEIDENIEILAKFIDKEFEEMQSEHDADIKRLKKEREKLDVAIENFGTAAALINVVEAMENFKSLSMKGDDVHSVLSQMLESILSRYGEWIECMEVLAEDPSDAESLDALWIARQMISDPNIPHPNPFFDMETEPENVGKKLLEY